MAVEFDGAQWEEYAVEYRDREGTIRQTAKSKRAAERLGEGIQRSKVVKRTVTATEWEDA
jgi:hypothetical protein